MSVEKLTDRPTHKNMQTQFFLRSQWNLAATRSCPWMSHGDRDLFQVAGCDLLEWEELAVSFLRLVYYYKGSSSSSFFFLLPI